MPIKNLKKYLLLKWFDFVGKGLLTDIALITPLSLLIIYIATQMDINLLNKQYLNVPKTNKDSLMITGVFITHPTLWLISIKAQDYPSGKFIEKNATWYIDGRKLEGQGNSIITIPLDSWLGLRSEIIKGCRSDIDYRLNRCATYQVHTNNIEGDSFPPEATLFTYMSSKNVIRAGYYYHSRTMSKEGESYFYWIARNRNGDMELLKKCQPRMECKLTIEHKIIDMDVGAVIQPIDINGTLGRGDVSWFHYDKRGQLLGKDT